jgi:NitT/TauT family transport system substrate-binding protein
MYSTTFKGLATRMKQLFLYSALGACVLFALAPSKAQQTESVKFVLDWKFQGSHAPWGLAIDRGYFQRGGLTVVMDQGTGSSDAINKVASGAYDIGFADINLLVKFNADYPQTRVIGFLVLFEQSLNSITTLKGHHINEPRDLEGKTIAGALGDSARIMFPIFARITGIDTRKIVWQSVSPQLRASLLLNNQLDAISGFTSGTMFDLMGAGAKRGDITYLRYSDYGLDLYGNSLITSEAYARKHPDVLRKFAQATISGLRDATADPVTGVGSLKNRDSLVDVPLEVDRLRLTLDQAMLTKEVLQKGFGTVEPTRLAKGFAYVAEAFGVPNPPTPNEIYTDAYLPAPQDSAVNP